MLSVYTYDVSICFEGRSQDHIKNIFSNQIILITRNKTKYMISIIRILINTPSGHIKKLIKNWYSLFITTNMLNLYFISLGFYDLYVRSCPWCRIWGLHLVLFPIFTLKLTIGARIQCFLLIFSTQGQQCQFSFYIGVIGFFFI